MQMCNHVFRCSGTNDIVDYMAGTHMLELHGMTGRLLQTDRSLALLPNGVPFDKNWVVSPPCAGVQDVAR
eukprot:6153146-Prorocentrum_lima.AAC.1